MLERILIPLDGSKLSEASLGPGVELARAFDAELHLLGVCEGPDEKHHRLMQAYLERNVEAMRGNAASAPRRAKTVVLCGDPAGQILDYAAREQVSLLIMVTHGHSGIMPWTMGGTANKIVHGAPMPVLLLRATAVKKKGPQKSIFGKILLPLDGSGAGETAATLILEIAARLKSEVTLLTVIESSQRVHTIGGLDYIRFPEQEVEKTKRDMSGYLDCAVRRFRDRGIEAHSELRSGHAAEVILKSAKAAGAQLVAMSSHGKSGLREWVFGSVSQKVLHAGKTHLLLVKPTPEAKLFCPR
jgi:nucleotide-binding universal stress UspA family protein